MNYIAFKLDKMSQPKYEQFQVAMAADDHGSSLQDMIDLTENLDCYEANPYVTDYDDLGRYYITELESVQIPEYLENYVDYKAYGRDVALDKDCQFTETAMSGIPRNLSWRFTTETQRIPRRSTGSWLFPNKKLKSGWILTRKLSGKKIENPGKFHIDEMLAFAEKRSGNTPPRRQSISRPRLQIHAGGSQ